MGQYSQTFDNSLVLWTWNVGHCIMAWCSSPRRRDSVFLQRVQYLLSLSIKGLAYLTVSISSLWALHMHDCIRVFFYFVNSSHYSSYSDFCTKCNILDINLLWNIFFFWSRTVWYETIELFILWHVWKCFGVLWVNSYQLAVHSRESCMIEQALLPHWLCNQKHPCM